MSDVCAAWGTCSLPRNHDGPCVPTQPGDGFDNTTEACRHCPTPDVHPTRIGGILTYEGRCDPDTCERHDHSEPLASQARPERTNIAGGPLLEPHDGGCRCWPHVSQSDALRAVEHTALLEYRSARAASQERPPIDVERQRIAGELRHYDLSDDPGYIRVPTERVRAILSGSVGE